MVEMQKEMVLGAIYGHLAGDALGVPYEFKPPEEIPPVIEWKGYGTHDQPPGTWSDDGALMLCTLASLLECEGIDFADMGERFVRWFDEGYMAAAGVVFDYGGTTFTALNRLRSGVNPLEAGPKGEFTCGDGSLMRILPFSLWTLAEPVGKQIELSHECSCLTHGHPRAQACCAIHSLLARWIVGKGEPGSAYQESLSALSKEYRANERWGEAYLKELQVIEDFYPPSGDTYVVDCLISSWQALKDAGDYPDAVKRAVAYGHDTDTTAAVTGGLAGLVFGVDSIPEKWLEELRLEDEQTRLIEDFADTVSA